MPTPASASTWLRCFWVNWARSATGNLHPFYRGKTVAAARPLGWRQARDPPGAVLGSPQRPLARHLGPVGDLAVRRLAAALRLTHGTSPCAPVLVRVVRVG